MLLGQLPVRPGPVPGSVIVLQSRRPSNRDFHNSFFMLIPYHRNVCCQGFFFTMIGSGLFWPPCRRFHSLSASPGFFDVYLLRVELKASKPL